MKGKGYCWFSPLDSLKSFMLKKLLYAQNEKLPFLVMNEYQKRLTDLFFDIQHELDKVEHIKIATQTCAAQFFWLDLRESMKDIKKYWTKYQEYEDNKKVESIDPKYWNYFDKLWGELKNDPAEIKLLKYIAKEAEVLLLPGQTLSCKEAGFFRLCFTCYDPSTVRYGVRKLMKTLVQLKELAKQK